jgi:hypothetical protein
LRLVAGGWFVLRENYCWLVADKPSEQAELAHGYKILATYKLFLQLTTN